jgi:hypothetical protein
VADVDDDDDNDLLLELGQDVSVFRGPFAGDRSAADAALIVRGAYDPRAVGDLDGDGIGDFAFATELVSGAALRDALP